MNRVIPADIQAMGLRGEIEDLRAKLAELHKENARLREDAERYRWLRKEHAINDPIAAVAWKRSYDRNESEWVNTVDAISLDEAIDAARKEQK